MRGRRGRALSFAVGLGIAVPFYLVLIDTVSSPELIAGGVAVVLAAGSYSAAYLESTENAALRLRWLSVVVRELAKVPRGAVVVCAEILSQTVRPRPSRGVMQVEPYDAGAEDDPYALGRRALDEAWRSFAPNSIVFGVDPDHDRLVLHRIGARG